MDKLTQNEIDEAEAEYLKWQKLYNETGDTDIVWFHLHPYIKETSKSILKMMCGRAGKPVLQLEAKSDEIADTIAARYLKDKSYNKDLPKTLVYWGCVGVQYSESARNLDAEEPYCAIMKEHMFDELYRNGDENNE